MRFSNRVVNLMIVLSGCQMGIAQTPNTTMTLDVVPRQISLHEPVYIALEVRNGGSSDLHLDLGANREANFVVFVTDPNGRTTGPLRESAEGLSRIGKVTVSPTDTFRSKLLLSKLFSFTETGEYSVEVRLDSSAFDASDSNLSKQATSKVTLTVLPRSPQKLQTTAQELSEEAIHARSYETRLQAVSALSYMGDPVAVPYLKRVLQEGQQIQIEAAQGLARIENPEAIDALVAAETTTTNTELRGQLKIILRDLLNKVQESDTRAKIAAALQRS